MADDDGGFDEDDGGDMKPPQASELTAKQLAEELVARGLKPSGFPEDDIKALQKHLNAEFESQKEALIKERREALKKRRAEEEALRMQRFLEKQKREEEEAVSASAQLSFFIEQLRTNATAPDMAVRERPVGVRAFLKAAIATGNSSLQSLDLVGCGLGDDVGVEVGALIRVNKGLRRIDLDYNAFGPKTLAAIALSLQSNATLVALSLEHNRLTGEAQYSQAALAAAAATENESAQEGGGGGGGGGAASSNSTSAAAAAASAANFAADLAGVAALAAALARNSTLCVLNLFQTGLTAAGGHLLREAVEANEGLVSVALSAADGVDPSDMAAMTARLARNGAAKVARAAEAKGARAAARRKAVAKEAEDAAASANEAEARWIKSEQDARERVRAEVEFERYRKERMAMLERENQEKQRKERLKAEAEEAAKKAKKK